MEQGTKVLTDACVSVSVCSGIVLERHCGISISLPIRGRGDCGSLKWEKVSRLMREVKFVAKFPRRKVKWKHAGEREKRRRQREVKFVAEFPRRKPK